MTILMMLLSSFRVNRFNLIEGDLCINMNNHQKSTFHPLVDFLNPALALLGLYILVISSETFA
jgi:hypothetical protein